MSALLFFLVVSLAWTRATWAMDYNLTHSVSLDTNVNLKWGFDIHQGNITFELEISTTGWVGFGFSPHGGMNNADIVMGGLGSNGSYYFADRFATGDIMPTMDEQQNYHLISMTEHNGKTIMTFHRLMDTKDPKDYHITDQTIYLIYAYGDTDEMKYHEHRRGQKEVNLLNYTESSATSRFCASWTVTTGGTLLLLWIAFI